MQVHQAGFDKDPVLREYGLTVHQEMEKVMGRVLSPPAIQYREQNVRFLHPLFYMLVDWSVSFLVYMLFDARRFVATGFAEEWCVEYGTQ